MLRLCSEYFDQCVINYLTHSLNCHVKELSKFIKTFYLTMDETCAVAKRAQSAVRERTLSAVFCSALSALLAVACLLSASC